MSDHYFYLWTQNIIIVEHHLLFYEQFPYYYMLKKMSALLQTEKANVGGNDT